MLSHVLVRTREVLHTTILFELQRHAHYCNSTATQLHAIVFCIEAKRWPRFSLVLTHYCDCRGSCGVRFIFLFFFFILLSFKLFIFSEHKYELQLPHFLGAIGICHFDHLNWIENVKFGTFSRMWNLERLQDVSNDFVNAWNIECNCIGWSAYTSIECTCSEFQISLDFVCLLNNTVTYTCVHAIGNCVVMCLR